MAIHLYRPGLLHAKTTTIDDAFAYPWVRDYVPHPIRGEGWAYVDIDAARQASKK